MLIPPFTLEQAIAICRDYQAIIGSIFEKESLGKGYIECVAVAPYEEAKQWLFAQYYKEYRDATKALSFYKGHEYDVIIIAIPFLRKRSIEYKSLMTYLTENNIPFDPYRYQAVSRPSFTDSDNH